MAGAGASAKSAECAESAESIDIHRVFNRHLSMDLQL
jgi:hypothetical protein